MQPITVEIKVKAPVEKVWKLWTTAEDIMQWNNLNHDWHSPHVEIDLKEEGKFLFRMETKDGSVGFDHAGKYDKVVTNELIEYTVSDGRKSIIQFIPDGDDTRLIETFEPEASNPVEMQKEFCQAIIDNFKNYAESEKNN